MLKHHQSQFDDYLHNNDGGGILSIYHKRGRSILITLFSTSQGLDYSGAAKLYGCGYTKISSPDELSSVLANIGQESGVHIIEIPTNREYSRQFA